MIIPRVNPMRDIETRVRRRSWRRRRGRPQSVGARWLDTHLVVIICFYWIFVVQFFFNLDLISYPSDWFLHLPSILRQVEPVKDILTTWRKTCFDRVHNAFGGKSNLRFFWVSALGALCSLTEGLRVPRTSPTFRPVTNDD